jgi:hypothetical protein
MLNMRNIGRINIGNNLKIKINKFVNLFNYQLLVENY